MTLMVAVLTAGYSVYFQPDLEARLKPKVGLYSAIGLSGRLAVFGVRIGSGIVTVVTGICDVTTCSLVNCYEHFGGTYCLHVQVEVM